MTLAILFSFWFGGFVVALAWTIHDLSLEPHWVAEIQQNYPVRFFACLAVVLAFWMIVIPFQLAALSKQEKP